MQAGFGLEPLAGEAQRDGGAGGGAELAEGLVAGGPDFGSGGVDGEGGEGNVVCGDWEGRGDVGQARGNWGDEFGGRV